MEETSDNRDVYPSPESLTKQDFEKNYNEITQKLKSKITELNSLNYRLRATNSNSDLRDKVQKKQEEVDALSEQLQSYMDALQRENAKQGIVSKNLKYEDAQRIFGELPSGWELASKIRDSSGQNAHYDEDELCNPINLCYIAGCFTVCLSCPFFCLYGGTKIRNWQNERLQHLIQHYGWIEKEIDCEPAYYSPDGKWKLRKKGWAWCCWLDFELLPIIT